MVTQNYLDIYPTSGIANQLNAENLEDETALKRLAADIKLYFKKVSNKSLEYYRDQPPDLIDPASTTTTFKFFRSRERTRNTHLTVRYLVTFLSKIPLKKENEEEGVNCFEQLKSLVLYNINLLKENNVTDAILKEHEKLGLLNETNIWYYRGQVNKNYRQLLAAAQSAESAVIEDYCKLFETLQRLSVFWFSVRNEDINRVRKSDLYIYRLTRLLMKRNGCSVF